MAKSLGPKTLFWDIETSPLEALVWGLHGQFLSPGQITKDRTVLSVAAKWSDKDTVMQWSTAGQKDLRDDKAVVTRIRDLLDEADIVVTQNGKRFDEPIVKGRMAFHHIKQPSPYRHIDTYQLAKKLGFPSCKQEYLTKTLRPDLEKSKHNSFPGVSLWVEYLAGNRKAWREMAEYNKQDVRGLEGVYNRLSPFGTGVNLGVYKTGDKSACPHCGSDQLRRKGYAFTNTGKYQIYSCKSCGAWPRGKENLLSAERRASLKKGA